jgi:ABC-2 type transport system permease protein
MFKALEEAFASELQSIQNSTYKLFLITLLPLISFGLIIAIFYEGVVRDMPIAVIDNDKSNLSRELLFNIESSPTIKIAQTVNSLQEAIDLVQRGEVYGIVTIPEYFLRDTLLHKQPHVTVMLNTQYILIGKILTAALSETLMYSAAEVDYVETLMRVQNPQKSLNVVTPIGMQVTPFFNTYQNYFLFLVSALLPAIWQIFIVISTLVAVGSLFKSKSEQLFFKDKYVGARLIGMMLPYSAVFMLLGVLYLFYIYGTLGWNFEGSFAVMLFGIFLTTVAYQAVALLLFVTGFDYARSLSLGAVYTAPAFAFLGVTFPIFNMNDFALFWRDMLPISHLVSLQISQANYGADIFLEQDKLLTLFAFWIVFIPVVFAFKKRLKV